MLRYLIVPVALFSLPAFAQETRPAPQQNVPPIVQSLDQALHLALEREVMANAQALELKQKVDALSDQVAKLQKKLDETKNPAPQGDAAEPK